MALELTSEEFHAIEGHGVSILEGMLNFFLYETLQNVYFYTPYVHSIRIYMEKTVNLPRFI